jgi:hypothetical protein
VEPAVRPTDGGSALCISLLNGVHSARPLIPCVMRCWWGDEEGSADGRSGVQGRTERGSEGAGSRTTAKARRDRRTKTRSGGRSSGGGVRRRSLWRGGVGEVLR